jgi:hypothetical protein
MSCGNRFQCALRNPSRFSFKPDKPSNPELFNENQKKLNDLLKAREEMDKSFSFSTQAPTESKQIPKIEYSAETPVGNILVQTNTSSHVQYTPWKVPSTQDFKQNKVLKLD